MRALDLLGMARASLGSNKLRSILTMGGITIGVFSVVGVMTALGAVNQAINSGLAVLGTNTFQIQKFPAISIGGPSWAKYRNRRDINYRQGLAFQRLMEPQGVPVTLSFERGGALATFGGRSTQPNLDLVGTNENYLQTNNYNLAFGRFITREDVEFARPVIVIGDTVAREFFTALNPLGQWIVVGGDRYQIIGVLEKRGTAFGSDLDTVNLIPITRYQSGQGWRFRSLAISVQAPSEAAFKEVQEESVGMMRLARGLAPGQDNDFEVFSNDSLQSAFAQIALIVGLGGFVISVVALVTAGVGIMNIMLVSVTERTREIGIRKSLGARSADVLKQFLIEAVTLCLLGGAGGILLGIGVGNAVAVNLLNSPPLVPWDWVVVSLCTCTFIGLVFGLYPAWKAANLRPIEALRFE